MDGDVIPALLGLLILALIISVAWKAKEQVQFDNLVDEEKTLKDYRLLAQRFRSDQFTSKQMTEEFKANPEFKDWYFKNYIALEKWRSI
jgi:L-lactate permease